MKRTVATFIFLIASVLGLSAQDFLSWQYNDRYFSLQAGTGFTTYYGDLKHNNNLRRELSNINLGLEARLLSRVSARVSFTHYSIEAGDYAAKDSTYEQQRNLSFFSKNWELNLNGMWYLNHYQGDFFRRLSIEPYAFAGIGFTRFNPKTEFAGETIRLADYDTEGTDYSQIAMVVPVGLGLKFKMNTFMNFNVEASYRFAFTDYLDDVSTTYASSYPDAITELIANRKDEIGVVNQSAYENTLVAGGQRGDASKRDSYLLLNFQLEIYLPQDLFSKDRPLFKKTSAGN